MLLCSALGETLEEGIKQLDATYVTFSDVKVQDRSLIWNTDLIENHGA